MAKRICGKKLGSGGVCTRPAGCRMTHGPQQSSVPVQTVASKAAAMRQSSEVQVLIARSGNHDWAVRNLAGTNEKTPPDILEDLAEDDVWRVRSGVARNHATPAHVLAKLAQDGDPVVRRGVAENPSASADVLAKLAQDIQQDVRLHVTENPAAPLATLEALAQDDVSRGVRESAVEHMRLRRATQGC